MNFTIRHTIITLFLILGSALIARSQDPEENCIVKVNAEWAVPVGSCMNANNSYKAYFVNKCEKIVDVKLAIQEKSLRWKTFNHLAVAPGDTIAGFACDGTGKYVTWFRPAGNKMISFPTDEEINRDYK